MITTACGPLGAGVGAAGAHRPDASNHDCIRDPV